MQGPNYQKIYGDLLKQKFPEKFVQCKILLDKESLSALDVIALNKIIFGSDNINGDNVSQKHRSYDEKSIIDILSYQNRNKLSNTQLARMYRISRNTVANWKSIYSKTKTSEINSLSL